MIIGNRGVGKTSLVSLGLKGSNRKTIRINCSGKTTYRAFAKDLLREIGVEADEIERITESSKAVDGNLKIFDVGIGAKGSEKTTTKAEGTAKTEFDAWTLYRYIRDSTEPLNIVIDEYDRIDPDLKIFHESIADLMKTMADHSDDCESKLIIVGISDSASSLLGEHRSIERSAREIYLRPLRREDIQDFLAETEEKLRFKFSETVKSSIVYSSLGYPYYVHLVGISSIDAMTERLGEGVHEEKNRIVSNEDFLKGVSRAVKKAFQSNLRKYRDGMNSLSKVETEIVKEVCRHDDKNPLKREELRKIMAQKLKAKNGRIDSALIELQQKKKVIYISRNRDVVRFQDPLMAPFLRTWYFRESLVKSEDPRQIKLL